ncbi:arginine repressor ArgR [Anopheles sinensis]|uniref:Arginine repressor ArgR n=1 Tax=Anopheles sinensis TaxID=74873 RepID=A0A084VI36_ANOSI|nr:arginine repressor ArgR [Anopheles sinensis]
MRRRRVPKRTPPTGFMSEEKRTNRIPTFPGDEGKNVEKFTHMDWDELVRRARL